MSEYPLAHWVPAHESNYRKAGRAAYSLIVVHVTDGHGAADPVAAMWQEPHHGSSAHFVIGQDGSVLQCVSVADIAWHAHAANAASVGIEHCARTPHELGPKDTGLPASGDQYAASSKLIAWLCRRAGIVPGPDVVKGHAQADPDTTHADCPTGALDLGRLMAAVIREYQAWENVS